MRIFSARLLFNLTIAVCVLVLQLLTQHTASAYSALAAAPEELRKTLVLGSAQTSQADADQGAIENCKVVARALQVEYAAQSCRVVQRQTVAGNGAVACDNEICASGYGATEQAARTESLENCKKNSKAPVRCGPVNVAWRDDKVSSQKELDAAEAAKSSPAVISESKIALYGLEVGKTKLASIPSCAGETLAKGQPYCWNNHVFNAQDPDNAMYRALQLRQADVVVNAKMFDVSTLYSNALFGTFSWAETWVTGDGIIRRIKFFTAIPSANAVKSNLMAKFGAPSNEGQLDWIDNGTGQVIYRTPTANWLTNDYQLFYNAKAPIMFDNPQGEWGSIEIYSMDLLRRLWDYDAKQQPKQRKM